MPLLDVSELMTDPDFAQRVSVQRRLETVGANGRPTFTTATFKNVVVVIYPVDTAIGGNALERTDAASYRGAALEIVTKFQLRGPAQVAGTNYQPDIVVYNGDPYIVSVMNDFAKFGPGFVRAELNAMSSVDAPPS